MSKSKIQRGRGDIPGREGGESAGDLTALAAAADETPNEAAIEACVSTNVVCV